MAKRNEFRRNKKKKSKKSKSHDISENTPSNGNAPLNITNEKSLEELFDRVKNSKKCYKSKEYLDCFDKDKQNWKFNKMLQVFILNHICNKEIFSEKFFEIFKKYFHKMNEKSKSVNNLFNLRNI
jgi:hypothetical protein